MTAWRKFRHLSVLAAVLGGVAQPFSRHRGAHPGKHQPDRGPRSRYMPHQCERERARRRRQIAKGAQA